MRFLMHCVHVSDCKVGGASPFAAGIHGVPANLSQPACWKALIVSETVVSTVSDLCGGELITCSMQAKGR